jgi:gliding motility-associated-like protein
MCHSGKLSNLQCVMKNLLLFYIVLFWSSLSVQAQYSLQGDGVDMGSNCYQLTAETTNQMGSIWYEELIDLNDTFELQFTMNFGDLNNEPGEIPGADGMMFVLQNESSTAVGNAGNGMGYGNLTPSLGIEFDTFQNKGIGDIFGDHIAIHKNGNVDHNNNNSLAGPVLANEENQEIEDGLNHAITIRWNPSTFQLDVYFDCEFRLGTTIDLINEVFEGESEVWWGFTASTGSLYNSQSVCLYENVSPSDDVNICPGNSTQLIAGGDINSSFTWFPPVYLDDPSIFNPIATPPSTQIYTVIYTDFCGYIQVNSIAVIVEPIELELYSNSTAITCDVSEITFAATTNYPNTNITWEASEGGEYDEIDGFNATTTSGGVYIVTVVSEDGECAAEDLQEITIDTASYSASSGSAGILNCYTPTFSLEGSSDNADAQFFWDTEDGTFFGNSNIPSPTITAGGTYTLTVTNPSSGCVNSSIITIEEDFTYPEISLGYPNGIISCETPSVQIVGTEIEPWGYDNIIEWSWSEGGGLTEPWIINPNTQLPGEYTLTIMFNENGCTTSSESTTIELDEFAFIDISSIAFPNVITPNGDEFNDVLKPFFEETSIMEIDPLQVLDRYDITVHNRWGQLVHESNGVPLSWDGRSNGDMLHSGAYIIDIYYTSTCGDTQTGSYKGVLEIFAD